MRNRKAYNEMLRLSIVEDREKLEELSLRKAGNEGQQQRIVGVAFDVESIL